MELVIDLLGGQKPVEFILTIWKSWIQSPARMGVRLEAREVGPYPICLRGRLQTRWHPRSDGQSMEAY